MTWEQFEETGAVKDYLSYKGVSGRAKTRAERIGPESYSYKAQREMEHGTDNHSDRHDPGGISIQ